jgi:serine/threonine-protein kinase
MSFDDRIVRPLGIPGVSPMYVRSGHLVFGRLDGTIAAVPFDLERLRVTGPAVTVLENVVVKGGGAVEIAVSPNGTLAYVSGAEARDVRLVDSTGNVTPLITAHLDYLAARFSPNGDRVVFSARDESGNPDIWVFHLATRSVARLTNDGKSTNPEWTPDGRRISWLYRDSTRSELRWQNADGSSAPQVLVTPKDPQSGAAWAPSGRYFLSVTGRAGRTRVFRVPVDSEPQLLLSGQRAYLSPAISRDGKWLAFTSNESGAGEVYVQPTSGGGGGRHQISLSGGASPRWSLDGRTLYYRESGIITAARLQFAPHFLVTRRDTLFADRLTRPGAPGATFDVSPVDGRFLIVGRGTTQPKLIVVLNWLDELRERMASTAKK